MDKREDVLRELERELGRLGNRERERWEGERQRETIKQKERDGERQTENHMTKLRQFNRVKIQLDRIGKMHTTETNS